MDVTKLGEPNIEIGPLRIWVHGRQFDDSQDYWDGNWLRITAHCAEGGGSVRAHGSILHLPELASFATQCESLHEVLSGKAELSCMEPNLGVELSIADSRGTIEAEVRVSPDHLHQDHRFRFSIDQSHLPAISAGVRGVLDRLPIRGSP